MEPISVWYVRTALIYVVIGATAGAWQLATRAGAMSLSSMPLRPLHVEVMLVGWLLQCAAGVALWILPFSREVSHDARGWVAWGVLNVGVLAVVAAAWIEGGTWLRAVGRALELTAGGLLLWMLWPRLCALPLR